jgi:hypothetical protein
MGPVEAVTCAAVGVESRTMGRHENTDNHEEQHDNDQGDSKPQREPWKDWGTDDEVRGGRTPGEQQR